MLAVPAALRKQLIDHSLASADATVLNRYLVGFVGVAIVFGVYLRRCSFCIVTWMGERVVADLRQAVYRRVVRVSPTFFESTRTGEVLSRLTADTTLVQGHRGGQPIYHAAFDSRADRCAGDADADQCAAHRCDRDPRPGGDRA